MEAIAPGRHSHTHHAPWHLSAVEEARQLLELNRVDGAQVLKHYAEAHAATNTLPDTLDQRLDFQVGAMG